MTLIVPTTNKKRKLSKKAVAKLRREKKVLSVAEYQQKVSIIDNILLTS